MVKLSALLAEAEKSGGVYYAVEYFPPRTPEGLTKLYERVGRITTQGPLYSDVTWGAGGGTSDLTLEMCTRLKKEFGTEPNMHLTCTNMEESKVTAALEGCKAVGIDNIVALRGDPPKGSEAWTATEGGFSCALDLVKHIRAAHGDAFCVSVSGYPEGHPAAIKPVAAGEVLSASEAARAITLEDGSVVVCHDADYAGELAYLKAKVDAGAELIITQMFFDVQVFLQFVRDCRAAGITVPIMPGIMLVQNYGGFKRMIGFCKSRVPPAFAAALDAVKDDEAAVRAAGVRACVDMCRTLIAEGIKGLHLYTLNLEAGLYAVLKELGLFKPFPEGVTYD